MNPATRSLELGQLRLEFFDVPVLIRSDSTKYLQLFERMYRHFELDAQSSFRQTPVECVVLTTAENPWGKPVVVIDDQVRMLNSSTLLEAYVYESILHSIISRVTSHFLIHAGVVSHNGHGVIIAADSGHGKTTLTLQLVRRGFKFLSDEMAALSRTDHRVYPFPRSLRIRRGTLERAGFPDATVGAPIWLDKLMLDIEDIQPNSLGTSATIDHIIVLRNPHESSESFAETERELGLVLDRIDDELIEIVRRMPEVSDLQVIQDYVYPRLTLRSAQRSAVLSKIEAACHERQILVIDVIKRQEINPTFELPPRLQAISHTQAAMELVRRFQGGHKSALLLKEFGGKSTQLFVELAAIIQHAQCHQLFVGHLEQSADLICGLVDMR